MAKVFGVVTFVSCEVN